MSWLLFLDPRAERNFAAEIKCPPLMHVLKLDIVSVCSKAE